MNKLGNVPAKILQKLPLNKPCWTSTPAKVFVGVAGTLLAISAAGVICLFSLSKHRPKTVASNALVDVFHTTKMTTPAKMTTAAEKGDGSVTTFPGTNQADNGTIVTKYSAIDQAPTPALSPVLSPASVPQSESKVFASDSEFLKGERPEPAKREQKLPKSVLKNLEKKRREAERKRSRLEDMYQKHLISSEAYKKGEREYKGEIEKYRSEVNAGQSLNNSLE